jgi:hypothetical protein
MSGIGPISARPNVHYLTLPGVANNTTSPVSLGGVVLPSGEGAILVEAIEVDALVLTTNDASNYWTITTNYKVSPNTDTNLAGATFNTKTDGIATHVLHAVEVHTTLPAGAAILNLVATKTGAPAGMYLSGALRFRIVGA